MADQVGRERATEFDVDEPPPVLMSELEHDIHASRRAHLLAEARAFRLRLEEQQKAAVEKAREGVEQKMPSTAEPSGGQASGSKKKRKNWKKKTKAQAPQPHLSSPASDQPEGSSSGGLQKLKGAESVQDDTTFEEERLEYGAPQPTVNPRHVYRPLVPHANASAESNRQRGPVSSSHLASIDGPFHSPALGRENQNL